MRVRVLIASRTEWSEMCGVTSRAVRVLINARRVVGQTQPDRESFAIVGRTDVPGARRLALQCGTVVAAGQRADLRSRPAVIREDAETAHDARQTCQVLLIGHLEPIQLRPPGVDPLRDELPGVVAGGRGV